MRKNFVGNVWTLAAIQVVLITGAAGAWAQTGCAPAYEARINELSSKIEAFQSQLTISGSGAGATEISLAAASVITPSLAIMASAPLAGLAGYDVYIHLKRKAAAEAYELLSNASYGDGRELRVVAKKLAKKHIQASLTDISQAILKHDAQNEFCPADWTGKTKLAGVKQIMGIIQGDLE